MRCHSRGDRCAASGDQDHADHVAWLQQLNGSYPPDDQVESQRAWYRRNSIEAFNSLRQDESKVRA